MGIIIEPFNNPFKKKEMFKGDIVETIVKNGKTYKKIVKSGNK